MLPGLAGWTARSLSHSLLLPPPTSSTRTRFIAKCLNKNMGVDNNLHAKPRRRANFRLCNVSSHTSEVLEIQSDAPTLHVLFVPGNPGVILFYKDFVEFLYELLEGTASVTAIGHVSHSRKNLEHGRMFSLQEQIDHKIDFIKEELQNVEIPILLVGHSIGSYISIEMFKKSPEKALRFLVRKSLGKSWSVNAVEAACSHLSQYHTMRNVLYMAMTEFRKLSEAPDWTFMRERKAQLAFLFGVDDHWGPLHLLEEISKHVPGISTYIEREDHTHGFCCTEAGSLWVAQHVVNLIKNQMACSNQ